ncbi:hypothetical protein SCLCIDRAFT_131321, partial [Scleroderma citrinum Foug A]
KGSSRLLRIFVSESAHLIWVLRCERTIQGRNHSPDAVRSRLQNRINHRITLDRQIPTTLNHKPVTRSSSETPGNQPSLNDSPLSNRTASPVLRFSGSSAFQTSYLTESPGSSRSLTHPATSGYIVRKSIFPQTGRSRRAPI